MLFFSTFFVFKLGGSTGHTYRRTGKASNAAHLDGCRVRVKYVVNMVVMYVGHWTRRGTVDLVREDAFEKTQRKAPNRQSW